MTPTATRLKARLDDRRRWFHNEWFFKWHHIRFERPVAIDTFDGRMAHYSGIPFSGTARDIYWDAIVRGVSKEITDQFAWVDSEVRNYNPDTALRAIDECVGQLASFARAVRNAAVKKDRILRGDGINFPPENDAGRWEDTSPAEIQSQADALKAALPLLPSLPLAVSAPISAPTRRGRLLTTWNENQWWLGPVGLLLAVAGVVPLGRRLISPEPQPH